MLPTIEKMPSPSPEGSRFRRRGDGLCGDAGGRKPGFPSRHIIACLLIVAATAAILFAMGRNPICQCGTVKLWWGVVQSAENSQHLSDWYSPSHLIHGFLFYGAGWLLLSRLSLGGRLISALLVECAWEIAENTDAVIRHYREATIALDYFGDSIVNSMSDIGFMTLGFFLASRLPAWLTILIGLAFELFTTAMIRDGLTLNVLMLLRPLDAVKAWQGGA